MHLRKDRSLDQLAQVGNVAQFVSFAPDGNGALKQTYSRVANHIANHDFVNVIEAIEALLAAAPDGTVNVRSYAPDSPRSREFAYGIGTVPEAVATVKRLAGEGLHVIVNETVDINDGGVSGVVQAGVMEFAPEDTPRCVEKPGVASLPVKMGADLLELVFGFRPELGDATGRVEFSIHPKPRGWKSTRTLLWEQEDVPEASAVANLAWPNRFSRHIGDKTYGLLMAHLIGLPVPETLAICRKIAPFRFGQPTGGLETWIRTSPREQEPGLFTTHKGWLDPFELMMREDSTGERLATVLSQQSVPARHSGAAVMGVDNVLFTEGVAGEGDTFMLGQRHGELLPDQVLRDVAERNAQAEAVFGPVRMEWVHDGTTAWIVQLHRGGTTSAAANIVPGDREHWIEFDITSGLEALRRLLNDVDDNTGLIIVGQVGMTSHVADLVRKSGVPTRIRPVADAD
ncbi:hypothetical protein ACWGK7_04885 [Sphingomonas aurantiaca]